MNLSRLALACGAIVVAVTTTPAFAAEDGKAYPGSACQRQFDNVAAPVARTQALILSTHDSPVKVFCPVVKDVEAGRITRAEVMVDDNHSTANISCELFSFRRDGSVQQVTPRATSGTSATPVALTFGAHTANPKGSYGLTCELPPGSGAGALGPSSIVGYSVVEE